MNSIFEIMNMLNWKNDQSTQKTGIFLASKIKDISIFIQPENFGNKAIWDNCAIILSQKNDLDLEPYLYNLLEWIQDINWPGALIILNRLKFFKSKKLKYSLEQAIDQAILSNDEYGSMWLDYLSELLDNQELINELAEPYIDILKKHYHNWNI